MSGHVSDGGGFVAHQHNQPEPKLWKDQHIVFESTPDGDIQTVIKQEPLHDGSQEVHQRVSLEESRETNDDSKGGHKPKLSLQFLDITLTGDVEGCVPDESHDRYDDPNEGKAERSTEDAFVPPVHKMPQRNHPSPHHFSPRPYPHSQPLLPSSPPRERRFTALPPSNPSGLPCTRHTLGPTQPSATQQNDAPCKSTPDNRPVNEKPLVANSLLNPTIQENKSIVVPIPIHACPLQVPSRVNRKHRRVLSGRSHRASAHRRINSVGVSTPTKKGHHRDNSDVDVLTDLQHSPNNASAASTTRSNTFLNGTNNQPGPSPLSPELPHSYIGHHHPYHFIGGPYMAPNPYYGGYYFDQNNQSVHSVPFYSLPPPHIGAEAGHGYFPPQSTTFPHTSPSSPRTTRGPNPNTNSNYAERAAETGSTLQQFLYVPPTQRPYDGYDSDKISTDENLFQDGFLPPSIHCETGANPSVFDDTRITTSLLHAKETTGGNETVSIGRHHRKHSSLSTFLATPDIFPDLDFDTEGYDSAPDDFPCHKKSLSSGSFLRSLSDDNFLRHLSNEDENDSPLMTPSLGPPNDAEPTSLEARPASPCIGEKTRTKTVSTTIHRHGTPPKVIWEQPPPGPLIQHSLSSRNTGTVISQIQRGESGDTCKEISKRLRRKCSVVDCPNRVVQGGLCISHGAKRKTCSHPGCTKNVKKAGLCSTHGPARKRCEADGCAKVAVQGGRCIAHGAKKKTCSLDGCVKQAIMGGMCKKHHDEKNGVVKIRASRKKATHDKAAVNNGNNTTFSELKLPPAPTAKTARGNAGHLRGLSIFQDMTTVDTIINHGVIPESPSPVVSERSHSASSSPSDEIG